MTTLGKILTGAASIAAISALASPAAAQTNPYGSGYAQPNGVIGQIINSVTGYGQYPMGNYGYAQVDQRTAVNQCAAAAEQRLNAAYRGQGYGAANGYNGYQNGYGQNAYGYGQRSARVVGITSVERRGSGLRVKGIATSGAYAGQYGNPYQGYANQGYANQGYANTAADLSFNCKVSLSGQVTDVRIARNQARYSRGY